jgi:hypothetical protein
MWLLLIMRPVIIYCRLVSYSFPLQNLSVSSNLRPKKTGLGWVVGYTLGLISERDPKETHSRPKRDLFATSVRLIRGSQLIIIIIIIIIIISTIII